LRDRVEESTFDCRDEMLDIYRPYADLGRREWLLRRLDGGEPFKELLRSVFSDQRNSGYMRVYYTSEPDYNAIKINQAQGMIAEGDFDGAVSLLRPIREDKRCLNTLATAYYRLGDKATALDLFKQAAAMGDKVDRTAAAARNIVPAFVHFVFIVFIFVIVFVKRLIIVFSATMFKATTISWV